jgi:chromosome partitioning protein
MKTALVYGPKGGPGKSTITRNLAAAAAADGFSTATLDTDAQGTLSHWHKARPADSVVIRAERVPLADIRSAPVAVEGVDLLIIDTPTAVEAWPMQMGLLINAADLILMPIQPSPEDVLSMAPAAKHLAKLGRPFTFVVNRARTNQRETREVRALLAGLGDVAPVVLPELVEMPRSFAAGLGVVEFPGARSATAMRELWHHVAGLLGLVRAPEALAS